MARNKDDTCLLHLGSMLKRKKVIFLLVSYICIQQILNKPPHSPPYFYERSIISVRVRWLFFFFLKKRKEKKKPILEVQEDLGLSKNIELF